MKGRSRAGVKFFFFLIFFVVVIVTYFLLVGFNIKQVTPPDDQMVLISPLDLPEGSVVSVPQMQWQAFPLEKIEPDMIKKNQHDIIRSIEGAIVRVHIMKDEPVKEVKVIKTGTKSALSAVIHQGMRAVPVPFSKISNAPPLISPGDVVDIIIPKRTPGSQAAEPTYVGQTILRNIRVLAVDTALQKNEVADVKGAAHTLTLEVNALQAEDLGASLRDGLVVISVHSVFMGDDDHLVRKPEQIEAAVEKKREIKVLRGTDVRNK